MSLILKNLYDPNKCYRPTKEECQYWKNIEPWKNPKTIKNNKDLIKWFYANDAYNFWYKSITKSPKLKNFYKDNYGIICNTQKLSKKFKSGWNPEHDLKWLDWIKSNQYIKNLITDTSR